MAKPPDRQRPPVTTPSLIPPIDVTDLTTYPLKKRHSKVRISDFAGPGAVEAASANSIVHCRISWA